MTAYELAAYMNRKFAMNPWPKIFEVDMETYGNAIEAIINNKFDNHDYTTDGTNYIIPLTTGPHKGVMFKNVELIPMKEEPHA
jgi:hypothetical protein